VSSHPILYPYLDSVKLYGVAEYVPSNTQLGVGYFGRADADLGWLLASDWPTPAKAVMQKMRAEAKQVVAGVWV
jgi:hypothetical protein